MKFLVEKIPSNRDELFAYALDRSLVDEALMVKRVRPWVNKKVIEYIGDGEIIKNCCTQRYNFIIIPHPKSFNLNLDLIVSHENCNYSSNYSLV